MVIHMDTSLMIFKQTLGSHSSGVLKKKSDFCTGWENYMPPKVFPVVMYGCESWTIKKAECQRIDAFELWCQRRLLRVPWTARSNQSILKEISPGCSLEGLMLKLKLQYFGYLMRRILIGKDSDAERDWGQEEKGTTEDEMAGWHH